ncbi:glyoxylase-like metal-dependent hydrolase (beta-lactamase superfamily II) [Pseudoclavibacter sp. JAI123]|uniref:MBL fold metallo-hydrolase n=1 Tax=Pseudoclavibacter sp. JAI123 TaxID=2723065 RepID=UPI0015CBA628|nr:MBL fold metallo-hydrolase [Pseudoclavibacter sp. JAI123]NYF14239.1 glyoxylase-like metal-dependent hydrolase (beta-lactamase superfamily II) [Pseudoclavibacter sp. JAI123]
MRPLLSAGDTEVYRVEEYRSAMLPVEEMFLGTDPLRPQIAALGPDDYEAGSDRLVMASSSYVVRSGGKVVVVDAGVGNGKPRRREMWSGLQTNWLEAVSSIADPADVDVVVNTHLHCDHVGWNTTADAAGAWVPTFPNARYLFNELDRTFITGPDARGMLERNGDFWVDSIAPVFAAEQAYVVGLPHVAAPGVVLEHAPGDTPGHMVVRVLDPSSGATLAIISGDALHHVLQVANPGLTSSFCSMKETAEATRRALLEECAATGVPLLAGHVASRELLYVGADGEGGFVIADGSH